MHLQDGPGTSVGGQVEATDEPRPWFWKRLIKAIRGETVSERQPSPPVAGASDVHQTVRALPTLLDSTSLPNGVVELVVEDFEAPTRQLFDIHDGCITLVQAGTTVPWTSISGPPVAWASALRPDGNTNELRLTGDERLARLVLAALPRLDAPA